MPTDALMRQVEKRLAELAEWLQSEDADAVDSQSHLDPASIAHAYWHHGYWSALSDIRRIWMQSREQQCSMDSEGLTPAGAPDGQSFH
jgi:hypothetical protein